MTQQERMTALIRALQKEMPQYGSELPTLELRQWRLLRSLMNLRPPMPADTEFLRIQDDFLRQMTREKGVTACESLPRPLAVWQGDITTLACDAIVNAANSQLLGCFSPCHGCIDNIIHTMAGVQLRLACHALMQKQGHEEPTGGAKITPGFNLPARYVLHTVGPIVAGDAATPEEEALLASCYRSCLELAAEKGLRSVAFCCISTGVFRFPAERAAEIALHTVRGFLTAPSPVEQVIFNVFKDSDREIYERLLGQAASSRAACVR